MFVGVLILARRLDLVRRIALSLLIPYLFMVIVVTLITRAPNVQREIVLVPFQAFKEALTNDFWKFEIQANILLFIPVGLLLSMIMNRSKFLPIILGTLISTIIEITQMITHLGTFEIDDLISNFLGVLIGYILYLPFRMLAEMNDIE